MTDHLDEIDAMQALLQVFRRIRETEEDLLNPEVGRIYAAARIVAMLKDMGIRLVRDQEPPITINENDDT